MEFKKYGVEYKEDEKWGNGSWFSASHTTAEGVGVTRRAWLPEATAQNPTAVIEAFESQSGEIED